MEADFWLDRWASGQTAFHEGAANGLLVAHLDALGLEPGARVFVPLCGKSRDLAWLRDRGHGVVGAELSRLAVDELYEELGVEPEVTPVGPLERFRGAGIEVFVGDVFALTREMLGEVAASYDRAALVALPAEMRMRYGAHLHSITAGAPQLVIAFEYDQTLREGPPFSVDAAEMARVYGELYRLRELARVPVPGGLRGGTPAQEVAWALA